MNVVRIVSAFIALTTLTAGLGDGNMRKWLLNQKVAPSGPAAGQSVVFGTKNRGQVIFAIEAPDPQNVGTNGVRTYFHLEKGLGLAGTSPGRYALSSLFLDGTLRSFRIGGWGAAQPAGVFEVNPGEIIYIGHLVFVPGNMKLQMSVEDRFEQFRAKLPPELAARVEKRLVTLPSEIAFDTVTTTPFR